jgi:alkylated DNA nucleotide flippase Atl1
MAADFQVASALKALEFLEHVTLVEGRPTTYKEVSAYLGVGVKHSRPVGQVMSRIDAACFYAGVPFLAAARVRKEEGVMNVDAFGGDLWRATRGALLEAADRHAWASGDFSRVRSKLLELDEKAAKLLWNDIEAHGQRALDKALQAAGLSSRA